jgi:hypothetical protein
VRIDHIVLLLGTIGIFSLWAESLNAQLLNKYSKVEVTQPQSEIVNVQNENVASFRHIPLDIGRNFVSLFSANNLRPFLIGAGSAGLMAFLDENEFDGEDDYFGHQHESNNGSTLGRVGEKMGNHVIVPSVIAGLAVTGQIIDNQRFKYFSYSLVQGYIVNNVIITGMKAAVGRTRPNQRNDRSFPSGHTSNAFTWATIASHYYGKKVAIPAYTVASFIAWSRVEMDAHYLSDVVFGAAIGYVVGKTVTRTLDDQVSERKVNWFPTASQNSYGLFMSYSW